MRPLVLSIGTLTLVLGVAWAQNSGNSGTGQQIPVGQTFKNFEFPVYQEGQLKATLTASQATGITQNRAETTDLKIQIYDDNAVTTTITSPKADLYINQEDKEQKMRTKNTVLIVRSDMESSAQTCDFDLTNKKYLLRTNVKVILKDFDVGKSTTPTSGAAVTPTATPAPAPPPSAQTPRRALDTGDSMLDSPGALSSTNSVPIPPTSPNAQ